MYVCCDVMLSILQSQSIEKGFKKAKTFEHTVVLLFLFMLEEKGKKSVSLSTQPCLPQNIMTCECEHFSPMDVITISVAVDAPWFASTVFEQRC